MLLRQVDTVGSMLTHGLYVHLSRNVTAQTSSDCNKYTSAPSADQFCLSLTTQITWKRKQKQRDVNKLTSVLHVVPGAGKRVPKTKLKQIDSSHVRQLVFIRPIITTHEEVNMKQYGG